MSIVFDDEFNGVGGSYEMRDGKRVRVHETKDREAAEINTANVAAQPAVDGAISAPRSKISVKEGYIQ